MQSVAKRLEALERIQGEQEPDECVVFVSLWGREVPRACEDVLLERHRAAHPNEAHRFINCFDADNDYRCLACGALHEEARGPGDGPRGEVVVKKLGNVSMSEV